jgi:hypothetical protein
VLWIERPDGRDVLTRSLRRRRSAAARPSRGTPA